jgi:lipopolysaccharide transport system permease protein
MAMLEGIDVEEQQSVAPFSDGQGGTCADLPPAGGPAIVIEPARAWQPINFRELWQFRELLFFLAWRDVKIRYKQTVLGAAWAILQPALMMIVFTMVFAGMAQVPSDDIPYPLFSYAGLVGWTFFATGITSAASSVVGSERLITKIYFPRLAIPFAAVGAAAVDFLIAMLLLVVMMLRYRIVPGPGLLLVPALLALLALAALGVGSLLAALTVYYRDFRYVVPFAIQIGMFSTPAIYMQPRAGSARWVEHFLALNPINSIIAAFRAAVLGRPVPWSQLFLASALVAVAFFLGCLYFRHVEDQFADFI